MVAAVAASWARFGTGEFWGGWALAIAPLLWVVTLAFAGTYRLQVLGGGSDEYRAISRSFVILVGLIAVVSYVGAFDLPRGLVLPLLPAMFVGSLVMHWLFRKGLIRSRVDGEASLSTVVVGRADSVAQMIREITSAPEAGMNVVGACVSGLDSTWTGEQTIEGVRVFGPPESALAAVDFLDAEMVAVSSHPDLTGAPLRRLGWALAERQVELVVSPGIVEVAGPRLSLRPAAGLSLLHVERPINSGSRMVAKRLLDSVVGTALTLLALPLFLIIAVLVKVTSPGPVFFRQERVGVRGESFQMIKFRTMVVDAEARLAAMSRDGQANSVLFKDRRDPRITSVGRVLRKLSIDELPQLFNVLLGDMSLVGPRPPLRREVDAYEPDAVQRLRVRPGMTGLWQISGRSDLNYEQSIRLDLWYVDNWSPILDLQILVRTFKAVIEGRGAY
jgi:exopolysaccharide biosynthesis polyprenyl glycosylphosphotransferase